MAFTQFASFDALLADIASHKTNVANAVTAYDAAVTAFEAERTSLSGADQGGDLAQLAANMISRASDVRGASQALEKRLKEYLVPRNLRG